MRGHQVDPGGIVAWDLAHHIEQQAPIVRYEILIPDIQPIAIKPAVEILGRVDIARL